MAVVTVSQSAANAAKDSLIYELTVIVNALAADINTLTAKLDADAGVTDTDYAATLGTEDTITFRETGTPS